MFEALRSTNSAKALSLLPARVVRARSVMFMSCFAISSGFSGDLGKFRPYGAALTFAPFSVAAISASRSTEAADSHIRLKYSSEFIATTESEVTRRN